MKRYYICLLGLILVLVPALQPVIATELKPLKPVELKVMLAHKDFFLLDVHIPEQTHIPGTDAFIDFRKIRENIDRLPAAKDTKIVVYCLGGHMGRIAGFELIKLGYTDVFELKGGRLAFNRLSPQ